MTKLQQKLARTYEEDGYSATLTFWTENQDEINALSEKERNVLKSMMSRYCRINGDEKTAEVVLAEEKNSGNSEIANFFFEFAQIYQYGKTVAKNEMKAAECFKKAALCGNKLAQYRLGEMYMLGLGVEKSRTEAEKWYTSANAEKDRYSAALSHMTIPDGIECIEECAFEGFDLLRSVVIPESVKRIGDRAFKGCRYLENVKFSDDSIVLGFDAFEGCPLNEETKELINKTNYVFIKGNGNIKDFYIGRFPVTQDLYEEIMGENPSYFKGARNPVDSVSWYDAIYFCNKLSEKSGYTPVYEVNGKTDVSRWGYKPHRKSYFYDITQNPDADGFRLPTNDEWVYAAKGGRNYIYVGSDNLDKVGWYHDNSGGTTHPVGEKKPNGYGLYDMSGNVCEWVWDSARVNPASRYSRGGSYGSNADDCEVSNRLNYIIADFQYNSIGFRLLRPSGK